MFSTFSETSSLFNTKDTTSVFKQQNQHFQKYTYAAVKSAFILPFERSTTELYVVKSKLSPNEVDVISLIVVASSAIPIISTYVLGLQLSGAPGTRWTVISTLSCILLNFCTVELVELASSVCRARRKAWKFLDVKFWEQKEHEQTNQLFMLISVN